jgi:uncharacterized protein (DUF2267 family)
MSYEEFVHAVEERSAAGTTEEAERAAVAVLQGSSTG